MHKKRKKYYGTIAKKIRVQKSKVSCLVELLKFLKSTYNYFQTIEFKVACSITLQMKMKWFSAVFMVPTHTLIYSHFRESSRSSLSELNLT